MPPLLALLFATVPQATGGDTVLEAFQFHRGETLPEPRIHFLTLMSGGCTRERRVHR